MRKIQEYDTDDGRRFRVRYRRGTTESSETFRRKQDAETFRDILGDSRGGRVGEALAWLDAKRKSSSETVTFGAYFETYLEQLTGVTPRTRADYRAMHRRYLTSFDPLPMPLVARAHVAALVNKLEADGLSPKTIKNVIHMLSSVFGLAIDDGLIARNPVHRVRLPKQQLVEDEIRFLTIEEAAALIEATPEHYQPLVTFLFGTGLRWSEATAIQARHVNLAAGTVRVQRAWKRIPGGWEIGPPKSQKSNRTVNAAVDALIAVRPLLRKPSDLVFQTPTGKVVRHSNFYNRIWVPSCERAGLDPRPTPHDTRHTFASWLISDGIGLEAVQDQLGHESYETTRKVYAHLLPAVGVAAGKSASAAMTAVLAHRAQLGRLALVGRGAAESDEGADSAGHPLHVGHHGAQ